VRELENVMGHAVMMATGEVIELHDLPGYLLRAPAEEAEAVPGSRPDSTLAQVQREHILQILREESGVISTAADRLGLKRTTLYALMSRLDISRMQFSSQSGGLRGLPAHPHSTTRMVHLSRKWNNN
jgi:two-component system response regulator HydG